MLLVRLVLLGLLGLPEARSLLPVACCLLPAACILLVLLGLHPAGSAGPASCFWFCWACILLVRLVLLGLHPAGLLVRLVLLVLPDRYIITKKKEPFGSILDPFHYAGEIIFMNDISISNIFRRRILFKEYVLR